MESQNPECVVALGERADGGGSDQVPAPFLPAEGSAKSSGPVFAVQRPQP